MEKLSTKIINSENKIARLSEMVGCTDQGKAWFETVTDPFKDKPMKTEGYPDTVATASVVSRVHYTESLSRPSSVPAGNNWDANIILNNIVSFHSVGNVQFNAQRSLDVVGAIGAAGPRGGLEMYAGPTGVTLGGGHFQKNMPLGNEFMVGTFRVLGMAFEIHDTTAEIEKQGSLVCYRMSSLNNSDHSSSINCFSSASPAQYGAIVQNKSGNFFQSSQSAALQPFSKIWEAKHGCYCVATMNSQTNQPIEVENVATYTVDTTSPTGAYGSAMSVDANNILNILQPTAATPFNYSGAMILGANSNSVFRVDVIYLVERFPNAVSDPVLATLATPSPAYDPCAIELYSRIARELPVATKVGNNDAGDWIASIADLLSTIGVPGMPIVKSLSKPVGGWIDNWMGNLNKTPEVKKETLMIEDKPVNTPVRQVQRPQQKGQVAVRTQRRQRKPRKNNNNSNGNKNPAS